MMNLLRAKTAPLAFLLVCLTGCSTIENRLQANITNQENISRICAQPGMTQVSIQTKYKDDVNDLLQYELGLARSGIAGSGKTVSQALTAVQTDLTKIYAAAPADGQAKLKNLVADVKTMQANASTMRTNAETAAKDYIAKHPISFDTAVTDFAGVLAVLAPQVQPDMANLQADVAKLSNDSSAALKTLAVDAAQSSSLDNALTTTTLTQDLKALGTSLDGAVTNLGKLGTNAAPLVDDETKAKLSALIDDLTTYEAARLISLELTRSARSIEYKLDQIDSQTWFVVSLIGFGLSGSAETDMGNYLRDSFYDSNDPTLQKLRPALVVAACDQITADSSNSPTNSVRALQVTTPFLDAVILGMSQQIAVAGTDLAASQPASPVNVPAANDRKAPPAMKPEVASSIGKDVTIVPVIPTQPQAPLVMAGAPVPMPPAPPAPLPAAKKVIGAFNSSANMSTINQRLTATQVSQIVSQIQSTFRNTDALKEDYKKLRAPALKISGS